MGEHSTLVVAAGVILDNTKTKTLLSFRHAHLDQGGLWEYPGGKVEAGETALTALSRELEEELAITPIKTSPLSVIKHTYSEKTVELHFFVVETFSGQPTAMEHQVFEWCELKQLANMEFPAANQPIAGQLQEWLLKQ